MKNLINVFIASLIFLILFSCSKDLGFESPELSTKTRSSLSIPDDPLTPYDMTLVGEELENPFSIQKLQTALSNLCFNDSVTFTITDRLLKFTFTDFETFRDIQLDSSFILFSHPLNRKILNMGEFYNDGRDANTPQDMYGIVSIQTQIPAKYTYEVLDEMDYSVRDIFVLEESFRITNNLESFNSYLKTLDVSEGFDNDCGLILPPDITCNPGCYPELVWDDPLQNPNNPNAYHYECYCPPPPPTVFNECGCPTYNTPRSLAGCIQVERNSAPTGPDGVDDVEVIVQDRFSIKPWVNWFFKSHTARTDANGCWKMDKRFSDNVFVWVRFANNHSFERFVYVDPLDVFQGSLNILEIAEGAKPIKDFIGIFDEADYKNISNIYLHWGTDVGSEMHRNWGAATVNNSVKEYLQRTTDITTPPLSLDILLPPTETRGAALMLDFFNDITLNGLIPDLSIGIDLPTTRRVNQLAFHEIAHASHFSQVGVDWWYTLFYQEFTNAQGMDGLFFTFEGDPYGDGTEMFAGHVALAESWAESLSDELTGVLRENILFRRVFDGTGFVDHFIPEGLYNDLEDNSPGENLRLSLQDNIFGYSRASLFQSLQSDVKTLEEYKVKLEPILPAGNNTDNLQELFDAYNFFL